MWLSTDILEFLRPDPREDRSFCGFLKRWRPGAVREHLERNCWTAFALQRVSATQHTHSLCLFPFTSLSYRHISGSKWLGRRPRLRWRRTTSRQRRPGLPTRHSGQGSRAQRERNVMASPLRLFRCEEWQEAAQSQLQPANAHGSKRRRTRKRMRPSWQPRRWQTCSTPQLLAARRSQDNSKRVA